MRLLYKNILVIGLCLVGVACSSEAFENSQASVQQGAVGVIGNDLSNEGSERYQKMVTLREKLGEFEKERPGLCVDSMLAGEIETDGDVKRAEEDYVTCLEEKGQIDWSRIQVELYQLQEDEEAHREAILESLRKPSDAQGG